MFDIFNVEQLEEVGGPKKPDHDVSNEIQYPVAHRLLEKCDAVLRLPGSSAGADNDVKIALERGLKVYYSIEEVPKA